MNRIECFQQGLMDLRYLCLNRHKKIINERNGRVEKEAYPVTNLSRILFLSDHLYMIYFGQQSRVAYDMFQNDDRDEETENGKIHQLDEIWIVSRLLLLTP